MASSSLNILFIFSIFLLFQVSLSLFLPLTKDPVTNHYLTRIYHRPESKPKPKPATLVLDLNSPFVYLDCSSYTSPITTLNCRSIQCTSATPNNCPNQSPPSDQTPCSLSLHSLTGSHSSGQLVQTSVTFSQDDVISNSNTIDSFLLLCVPPGSLSGLPLGQTGVFGLGPTRIGAMSQISHSFDHPKKFNLCLSPKLGMISTNNDKINNEFIKSMVYTPILETGDSSYSITLKAIKLQNKKLPLSGLSMVKISTIEPYTKVVSMVYREIINGFITEAEALHMPRYPPRNGFELCYGIEGTSVVPVIDLVLQSEMVKWRIYGHNSMVKLNEEVMCLGLLDGGIDLGNGVSILLGNHQLEDNLLEFDLGSSMFGFSSSLLKMDSSCAQLSLSSVNKGGGSGGGQVL